MKSAVRIAQMGHGRVRTRSRYPATSNFSRLGKAAQNTFCEARDSEKPWPWPLTQVIPVVCDVQVKP